MATQILVPSLGESVSEGIVATWLKQPGEAVSVDEVVMELETDKVTIEVLAPEAGTLASHEVGEGDTVEPGGILGLIDTAAGSSPAPKNETAPAPSADTPATDAPASAALSPAVEKLAAENPQVDPAALDGSGKDGRVTKGDMLAAGAVPGGAPASTTAAQQHPQHPGPAQRPNQPAGYRRPGKTGAHDRPAPYHCQAVKGGAEYGRHPNHI